MLESSDLTDQEKELLMDIIKDEVLHENLLESEEKSYKTFLEHVREIVLGMNDGLVEVLSVSAGLAGTFVFPLYVFAGGILVGIEGALSMGIGAYASSKTSTQITSEKIKYKRLLSLIKSSNLRKQEGEVTTTTACNEGEETLIDPKRAGL